MACDSAEKSRETPLDTDEFYSYDSDSREIMSTSQSQEPGIVAVSVKKTWGQAIKEQRLVKGLSQQRLASAIGVDQSLVSYWEHGAVAPTVERQLAIARALGIAPRALPMAPKSTTLHQVRLGPATWYQRPALALYCQTAAGPDPASTDHVVNVTPFSENRSLPPATTVRGLG
jgi:transcriptional regulator with XRE-family HTH domain